MDTQIFKVVIEKIINDGVGLAKLPSGKAIFIPFTMPLEEVLIEIIEEKNDYARGKLIDILTCSSGRRQPMCFHFGECGGCQYQHISYPHQLEIKKTIFKEQWARIAKIMDLPEVKTLASDLEFKYRTTLQFRLDKQGKLGFSRSGEDGVLPIRECPLAYDVVADFWPNLRFDTKSQVKRIEVRSGSSGEIMVTLTGESGKIPEIETDMGISIAYRSPTGVSVLAGDDHISSQVLNKVFRISAGAFFQVNLSGLEKILNWIMQYVEKGNLLLDAFCGGGLFSSFLAQSFNHVIGIEASPQACVDYSFNLDEFDHCELYQGMVESTLKHLNIHPDMVILDPPRSGLAAEMVNWLVLHAPGRIIYISCNPSTLARDAKLLIDGGYTLQACAFCDMFPQTYHIESVNVFSRR